MKEQATIGHALLPYVTRRAGQQASFWRFEAHTQRGKDIRLQNPKSGSCQPHFHDALRRKRFTTYANTNQDHLDVAEHLRDSNDHIEHDRHELREARHP
jgi:hypothetical protein